MGVSTATFYSLMGDPATERHGCRRRGCILHRYRFHYSLHVVSILVPSTANKAACLPRYGTVHQMCTYYLSCCYSALPSGHRTPWRTCLGTCSSAMWVYRSSTIQPMRRRITHKLCTCPSLLVYFVTLGRLCLTFS